MAFLQVSHCTKPLPEFFVAIEEFFLFSVAKVHLFRDVDNFFNKN